MPTSENKKPERAHEFYYRKRGLRADDVLHQHILDGGDHEKAAAVSRKVAKKIGLTDEQIDRLMSGKQPK